MRIRLFVFASFTLYSILDAAPASAQDYEATAAPCCLFSCPGGDGISLADAGCPITLVATTVDGDPETTLTAVDFELDGCTPAAIADCEGGLPSFAQTSPGVYEFTGVFGAGGYSDDGLLLKVRGNYVPVCMPIIQLSPDISGDGSVNLVDVGAFAMAFNGFPTSYDPRADFNCDGLVNLEDLASLSTGLAVHVGHSCTVDPVD